MTAGSARSWLWHSAYHPAPDVRPILRHDASVMLQRGGLLCKSDQCAFLVTHEEGGGVLETLRPWLTGEFDVRTIAANMHPGQQQDTVALLETLLSRGILRGDRRDRSTAHVSEAEQRAFASQIELLHRFTDAPEAAFARFRHSRILLAGAGAAFVRCAASLLRNGLETLFLLSNDGVEGADDVADELAAVMADLQAQSLAPRCVRVDMMTSAPRSLRDLDLAVYCSDRPNWLDALMLNRHASAAERPFLGAAVFDGRSYLGPLIRPVIGGCWVCGVTRTIRDFEAPQSVARLREHAAAGVASPGSPSNGAPLACELASELASETAFEIFKLRTGVMPAQSVTDLRIESLERGAPTATMIAHAQTACRAWCKKLDRLRGAS